MHRLRASSENINCGTAELGRLPTHDRVYADVDGGASEPPARDNVRAYLGFGFRRTPEFFTLFGSIFSLSVATVEKNRNLY